MTSYLETQAPSPSTVCYTVRSSSRSSSKRPSATVLTAAKHALRAVVAFHVLLLNLAKVHGPPAAAAATAAVVGTQGTRTWTEPLFRLTMLEAAIYKIAERLDWWMIVAGSAAVLYGCVRRDYTEESLLVLQGLGIQTSTTSPYYFLSSTTTFIPTTRIQDMVIHEAFKGLGVRFYLAVIVEGATEVVVVFPTLLPRLDILQEVWRGARKCLYSNTPKPGG